ncbi:hypothetical protein L3Q82_013549 [Scortum barcoo]|uniref:Uncharacterized protein n=1 Tax=Scortum barcoo TaxID=214431 RepID=A0ACB8W121_9TELE|nr:hypothetical protein L3Q82_013549 [Scortum barcoo]
MEEKNRTCEDHRKDQKLIGRLFELSRIDDDIERSSLFHVAAPCNLTILTPHGTTSQSSDYKGKNVRFSSARAVDGSITMCSHTLDQTNSWWRIDLLGVYKISSVMLFNKNHHNLNMNHTQIYIGNSWGNNRSNNDICKNITQLKRGTWETYDCNKPMMGRYVTVFSPEKKFLILCEMKICGARQESPFKLIKENKTWEQALNHCRSTNRDLASILDSESQAWAELEAERAQTAFVWLGLRYTCTLEFWFWVEDHQLVFSRWSPNNKTEDFWWRMEILGSTFDDSVFCESRDRVPVCLSSYSPKVCEPERNTLLQQLKNKSAKAFHLLPSRVSLQWFCESASLETDDCLEKQKVYKFRGDLAVRQRDYKKALDAYSSCLEWIADNNLTIRRDVLEGMARCCAKLGQRDKALHLADLLSKEASNTCHLTSLLLLKVSIYQHFGAVRSKVLCLQQLCSLLPFNPWHWYNLGQTCLQLLDTDRATGRMEFISSVVGSCSPQKRESAEKQSDRVTEEEEEAAEFDEDRIWLKACTCFIRTRLLLRILRQQQSSFVLQRSESALQTTDETLQRLSPKETTLQALTEVMSEDLIPEKMREDYQDGESLVSVCVQSFRERWWNKVLLTGALETDDHQRPKRADTKP